MSSRVDPRSRRRPRRPARCRPAVEGLDARQLLTAGVVVAPAVVAAAPTIFGQVDNANGTFENYGTTTSRTLAASGTTQPGASVALAATSEATGQSLVVGTAVADASGAWRIGSTPFVDGVYRIDATVTTASGASATGPIRTSITNVLVVDAGGPKVASFRVVDARKGTFQVGFAAPLGLLASTATDASHYVLTRTVSGSRRGRPIVPTGLAATTTGPIPYPVLTPYGAPVLVTGTLRAGAAAGLADGTYVLTIRAAGVLGTALSPLDGEYAGRFPTGDGAAGGDFRARFTVRHGKASAPVPLAPARAATGHHA